MMRRNAVGAGILLLVGVLVASTIIASHIAATTRYTVTVGPWPYAMFVDTRRGHVFVVNNTDGSRPGTVSILDAATGALQHTSTVGVLPVGVAVDRRRGYVFVVNQGSGTVSVLDGRNGHTLRTVRVGVTPSSIVVDEMTGRAFVSSGTGGFGYRPGASGRVSVLDTVSGTVLRTVTLGVVPMGVAMDEHTGRVFVPAAWTGACPSSSACHRTGPSVSMLDATTGTLLRTVALTADPSAVAVDAQAGHVFVTSKMGRVVVLDSRSGRILHTVRVAQNASEVAVDERNAHVFVLHNGDARTDNSTVSMLDGRNGRVLSMTRVGRGASAITVSKSRGLVFVSNGTDNSVSVLDAQSGRLLRTAQVVQGPGALAVDDQTGHVFVASADVSNGVASVTGTRADAPLLDRIARSLGNGVRTLQKGRAGSVSMLNIADGR